MLSKLFKRRSREEVFWTWFTANSDTYYHFERNQNSVFFKLKKQLEKIHPDLTFEFGPILTNGTRELVISADGIQSAFPLVRRLTDSAPIIPKWKITAFRQPRPEVTEVTVEGLTVSIDDVFFKYFKDNGKIGLELHIRGFYESSEWISGIFILLDNILGEYDAETKLSFIEKKLLNETEIPTLFPVRLLPSIISQYRSELNN
jgi:hypothetical protein